MFRPSKFLIGIRHPKLSTTDNNLKKRCLKYMGKKKADIAESTCKLENARLPLPRSDQENSEYCKAFRALDSNMQYVALDINDVKQEGTFITSTGEKPTYYKWSPGEPNNNNNDDYVHLWLVSKWTVLKDHWNDERYDWDTDIVCEK